MYESIENSNLILRLEVENAFYENQKEFLSKIKIVKQIAMIHWLKFNKPWLSKLPFKLLYDLSYHLDSLFIPQHSVILKKMLFPERDGPFSYITEMVRAVFSLLLSVIATVLRKNYPLNPIKQAGFSLYVKIKGLFSFKNDSLETVADVYMNQLDNLVRKNEIAEMDIAKPLFIPNSDRMHFQTVHQLFTPKRVEGASSQFMTDDEETCYIAENLREMSITVKEAITPRFN